MMNEPKFYKVAAALLFLSCLGAWVVLWATGPWGLGLTTDSILYVEAAKNAALGHGFCVFEKNGLLLPLAYHPPAVPWLLSWSWYMGVDVYSWARILNALCFGLSIFLSGTLVFVGTRRSLPALMAGALVLCSPHILELHLRLLSEPLFLTFLLGCFLCIAIYIDLGRREMFYLAALLAAAALLTRYSGLAVAVAGALAIWRLRRSEERRTAWPAMFFLVVALAPSGLWLLRNMILTEGISGRLLGFHFLTMEKTWLMINALSEFFLPARTPEFLRWAALGFVTSSAIIVFRKLKRTSLVRGASVEGVGRLFLAVYAVFIFSALFIVGGNLVINHRILAPVYVVVFILAVPLFEDILAGRTSLGKKVQFASIIFILLFVTLMFMRTGQLGMVFNARGLGYASQAWANSRLIKDIRALAAVPVYANDPQAFYYLTGRAAVKVPSFDETAQHLPSLTSILGDFKERQAVVVMFKPILRVHADWWVVEKGLPLSLYASDAVVAVYGIKK